MFRKYVIITLAALFFTSGVASIGCTSKKLRTKRAPTSKPVSTTKA